MPHTLIQSFKDRTLQQLISSREQSVVITDQNVWKLYGAQFPQTSHNPWVLEPGECSKTREEKSRLEDQLLNWGIRRDGLIIAIGGGMVLDFSGFCAATYLRGIDCVYLPTTLIGMVDACIGGKTAVNTPAGKNLIGAFHKPHSIWINANTLKTLSNEDFLGGAIEWLKHFLLTDSKMAMRILTAHDPLGEIKRTLPDSILSSMAIKSHLVEQDPFDRDVRQQLNLGHTLGHALEWSSPQLYPHGIAVGYGIQFAAWISLEIEQISYKDWQIIHNGLYKMGLENTINIPSEQLIKLIAVDKKSCQGGINMVLPSSVGSVIQKKICLTQLQYLLKKWLRS